MKNLGPILVIVLSALCSSCVYFNTLYNAKSAYRQAHDSQLRRHESVSVDSVAAVTPEERTKFDRAIAKASKVLEAYPHKKKWADDAIFLIGQSYFQLQEYPKAARKFQELLANYPNSPYAGEAQILLARSHLGRGDFEAAMSGFAEFEKKYPKHKEKDNVPIYKAQTLAQMGTKSTAIAELNTILAQTPRQKADKTRLELARLNYESSRYEESEKYFSEIQDKNLSHKEAYEKGILHARSLLRLKKAEKALKILEKMEKDDRQAARLTEIWIEQASALEALGKYDAARMKLEKAVDRKDISSSEAYFTLAELERKHFGRLKEAKALYEKALQSRNADTRKLAQERIQSISNIMGYEKRLTDPVFRTERGDTASTGQLKYGIGEIYWFQLAMTDSALVWFDRTLSDSVTDSIFAPKAALAKAFILSDERHDSLQADSLLRRILVRFPKSDEAKAAQKRLGIPMDIITREDSAHSAFMEAEETLWKKDEAARAAELFDSLALRFSETSFAPQAVYTAAWIYDEILGNPAAARARYEKVYKDWKDSDYARAASRKLKAELGDSIEASLQEKKPSAPAAPKKDLPGKREFSPSPLPEAPGVER